MRSLKDKMLAIMLGLVIAITVILTYFAGTGLSTQLYRASDSEARNILDLSLLHIESQYIDLEYTRVTATAARQRELRSLMDLAETYVREWYERAAEIGEAAAQQGALEGLRQFKYNQGDYFFVSDYDSVLLSHPDPQLHGAGFSQQKDVRGTLIVPPLVERTRAEGEAFHSYWWRRLDQHAHREKLSYGRHFPQWRWILGSGVYIDDIEAETARKREAIVAELRQHLGRLRIARSGYVFLFDSTQTLLSHPELDKEANQKRINPDTGRPLLSDLMALPPGQLLRYREAPDALWKQAYVRHFAPLDWYLATSVYEEEIAENVNQFRSDLVRVAVFLLLGGIALAIFFARTLTRPIDNMLIQVETLANLNLSVKFNEHGAYSELNILARHLNKMVEIFRNVIAQVQRSGVKVTSSTTQLSATVKEQEAIVNHQVESSHTVREAVAEISKVINNLTLTMQTVAETSEKTAELAGDSRSGLARMENAMHQMESASEVISEKLQVINDKAENITSVVTTITTVADQTNLLSLNAAIEAEKAGGAGRGFTVVAREIRRLADQTAVATLDIEGMVKEMQAAVLEGVREMQHFISEVRHNAEDVEAVSVQLTRIIAEVQALTPSFDNVNHAMLDESSQTDQITAAVSRLSEEMHQTRDSLQEAYQAINELREAARLLQEQINRFHLD
jgi:methyl-accepting chemotaxis protein WspA